MTAGRGIVHSEMPEQEEGLMQGFQLWVNLPAKDKMTAPRYQDIAPERIPVVDLASGVRAKIIAGEAWGVRGPVQPGATEPLFLDLHLEAGAGATVPLAQDHNAFVYVYEGEANVGEPTSRIAQGAVAVLSPGDSVSIAAGAKGARLILVAGKPLHEPVAKYGPFVMNTRAELEQAFQDYQAGKF
jgi:quercetin 2,3-dioxygenase